MVPVRDRRWITPGALEVPGAPPAGYGELKAPGAARKWILLSRRTAI